MKEIKLSLLIMLGSLFLSFPQIILAQIASGPYSSDPEFRELLAERVEKIQMNSATGCEQCPDGIKIIPIYFHILYTGTTNNFTNSQLYKAVDQLNKDFAGYATNREVIRDEFIENKIVGDHSCIQFCWAGTSASNRVNMAGNPITGVQLLNLRRTFYGTQHPGYAFPSWYVDQTEFLNIWVADIATTANGTVAAAFSAHLPQGGIVIDDNVLVPGHTGNFANYDGGKTLSHEVGHYLGLSHIWANNNTIGGNFCGSDDGIQDTPNHRRTNINNAYTIEDKVWRCGTTYSGSIALQSEMWCNLMDYTNDGSLATFTRGQIAAMQLYLEKAEDFTFGIEFNDEYTCDTRSYGTTSSTELPNPVINNTSIVVNHCHGDSLNLLDYQEARYPAPSPKACYFWKENGINGPTVASPYRLILQHSGTSCQKETRNFILYIDIPSTGNGPLPGLQVDVDIFPDLAAISTRYFKSGSCSGPHIEYETGCESLVTITPVNPPTFPTTQSGTVDYMVTFDPSIIGPCYTSPPSYAVSIPFICNADPIAECPTISPGYLNILEFCEGADQTPILEGFGSGVGGFSSADPHGKGTGLDFFANAEFSEFWDYDVHMKFKAKGGDSCSVGETISIYAGFGCDSNGDGSPNSWIPAGQIDLEVWPHPLRAPEITRTINADFTCSYAWKHPCTNDDLTIVYSPSFIPDEECGTLFPTPIELNVRHEWDIGGGVIGGCFDGNFTVQKPSCPFCPIEECVYTEYVPEVYEVCAGEPIEFPEIEILFQAGPTSTIFWTLGDFNDPSSEVISIVADDYDGAVYTPEVSDPQSGMPETQIYFAYTFCDSDLSGEAELIELGPLEVIVNPAPPANIVTTCEGADDDTFFIMIELTNVDAGATYTASHNLGPELLLFDQPGVQEFGPFPNGDQVIVTLSKDGGACSLVSEALTRTCSPGACQNAMVEFENICEAADTSTYLIQLNILNSFGDNYFLVQNDQFENDFVYTPADVLPQFGPYPNDGSPVEFHFININDPRCDTTYTVHMGCDQLLTATHPEPEAAQQIKQRLLKLYPNPTTDRLNLEILGLEASNGVLRIYSLQGQLMQEQSIQVSKGFQKVEMEVQDLAPSIYYLQLVGKAGKVYDYRKFVIVR